MRRALERLAALAGANLSGRDRRQRRDNADAEQHRGLKEVKAEGAGGERAWRQAAEHDEVGRRHRVDRHVGENDRPAEHERRPELALERAARGCGFQSVAPRRPWSSVLMRGAVLTGDSERAQILSKTKLTKSIN